MPALRLRDFLYSLLPKPVARHRAVDAGSQAGRLLVLTNGRNPTFTYYLEERLARSPAAVDIRDLTAQLGDIDPRGLEVILCRYARPRQLWWLYRNRKRLAGASLLVDDDVAATVMTAGGNYLYKAYLVAVGIAPLPVLNRILTRVWASTPALAAVLKASAVLPPFPPREAVTPLAPAGRDEERLVMAFHATGSHDAEHAFLVPIVRAVLERCDRVDFEVVADGWSARLWRDAQLPATRFILHPKRDWTTYLAETARRRIDILLVPLLPNRMNDVRSATKRFDAARMGGAAIFSLCPVYEQGAGKDELLVANDIQSWVEAICRLVEDGALRRRTRDATVSAVEACLADTLAALPMTCERPQDKVPT